MGLAVGIATAVITVVGAIMLIVWVSVSARKEGEHPGEPHHHDGLSDDLVVDTNRLIFAIIVLGVLGVVLLSVVAWLVARRAVRPLSEALRLQRNFVADASHELRTPLTVLSTRVQLLQRKQQRGEPTDDIVATLRDDIDVLNSVLNDLLVSAENTASEQPADSDLVAVTEAAVDHLRPLGDDASIAISTAYTARPIVRLPAAALGRCLTAVIDNAIQHSPDGSAVSVLISAEARRAEVRVSNTGSPIPPERIDQIFERFQHGKESGRRRSFGLGLALVRDILNRYGGSITVDASGPADLTTFVMSFPRSDRG